MPSGSPQLILAEARFFVDQVTAGKITLEQARADIAIDTRTLAIWSEALEWEQTLRPMFTAAIKLRRKILENFEQLLEQRVRQTCQELDYVADAAPEPVEQERGASRNHVDLAFSLLPGSGENFVPACVVGTLTEKDSQQVH